MNSSLDLIVENWERNKTLPVEQIEDEGIYREVLEVLKSNEEKYDKELIKILEMICL